MKTIVSKLYKTLFWISFSIMIAGSCGYLYEIYDHTIHPTVENVVLHKVKTNSPFYYRSVLDAPTESDYREVKEDMRSSLVDLLGYYEYKNALSVFAFIAQFLVLIALNRWLSWVLKPDLPSAFDSSDRAVEASTPQR